MTFRQWYLKNRGKHDHDDTRDEMLARIRRSQPAPLPLPELPAFAARRSPRPRRFEAFRAALRAHGRQGGAEPRPTATSTALCAALFPDAKVICSATPEVRGTRPLAAAQAPATLDDVDVGVVRAAFGVAETGSVLLTEPEFAGRGAGLPAAAPGGAARPAAHRARPARRLPRRRPSRKARYAIFMTGPSATADIEGVLIHGAQGIRSLTLLPCASAAG